MNVTVYCGSNLGKKPEFAQVAVDLGKWIGQNGHQLVYGGCKLGIMGILATTVHEYNGKVIGVMPTFLAGRERLYEKLDEYYEVDTLPVRKTKMISLGDVFIALPGGPGTLEEISELISAVRLDLVKGPCFLMNVAGYYDDLEKFFDRMLAEELIETDKRPLIKFVKSVDELASYIG